MIEYLRVGVITSSHGLRGEVKVFPTTDSPSRYDTLSQVFLLDGERYVPLTIDRHRYFRQLVIVHFQGFDTIEAVEGFVKKELYVDRAHAAPLEDGEYYIADLIGLAVVDEEDRKLGTITDVLQTGANDVYVVNGNGKELLLPVIPDCILQVDLAGGFVRVHVMKGLVS